MSRYQDTRVEHAGTLILEVCEELCCKEGKLSPGNELSGLLPACPASLAQKSVTAHWYNFPVGVLQAV